MNNSQMTNLLTRKSLFFSISLVWQLFFTGKEKLRKTYSLQIFGIAWQNLVASFFLSLLHGFHMRHYYQREEIIEARGKVQNGRH